MESGKKNREVIWSGTTTTMGDKKRRGYHRLGDPPWEERGLSHILDTAAPGSDTRKTSPLSWFENQWGLPEGCKKPRLCS